MAGRMLWIDTLHSNDVAAGAQIIDSLMTEISEAQSRLSQMTLMRTLLIHSYARTVHDSGEGSGILDVGIGVRSQELVDAAQAPDPETAIEHPTRGWIYRARHRVYGYAADQPAIYEVTINKDIRSRRKLDNGEAYLVVTHTALEGVAGTIRVLGLTRQLWLVQ